MPYVDQGEPKPPPSLPPILPIAVTAVAMAVAIGLFPMIYTNLNGNQWLAPLLAGPLVGVAIRLTSKGRLPRAGTVAIIATLVACLVGYVVRHVGYIKWVDPTFKPSVGHAFEWLFSNDLMSILLIAMSAYLAFSVAAAIPYARSQEADQS
ncbi:MAG: hypothetical protein ACE37H_05335 [Phycisphaeraceae bacterium]